MSRKEKFGSSRVSEHHEGTAEPSIIGTDSNQEEALPPRRRKHSTQMNKITKFYYNLLFLLFVSLVGGLFWYGLKFTE